MANISIGRYVPYKSFLHRLDPRTKLISMIFLMVAILLDFGNIWMNLIVYFAFLIFNFILMSIAKIKLSQLFKQLKMMWFMMLFLFVINLLTSKEIIDVPGFGEVGVLFTIPYINKDIYLSGFVNTFYIVVRLMLMIELSLILTASTKPMDLTYALEWLLKPFKVIRLPVHEIAMIISLALRFIPTLLDDTERIMKAQASRGVDFNEGKFTEQVKQIVSLLIPMFVISIKRAEDLADAMEARGYIPGAPRTKLNVMKFHLSDLFGFIFTIIILVLNIIASFSSNTC